MNTFFCLWVTHLKRFCLSCFWRTIHCNSNTQITSGTMVHLSIFVFSPQLSLKMGFKWLIYFKKNYIFQGLRGGPTLTGNSTFFQRVQLLIPYRNPYSV